MNNIWTFLLYAAFDSCQIIPWKYNIFNQATGEDSFPPVPESYERGGVYVNIWAVYDYSDNCKLNCIYLELHT